MIGNKRRRVMLAAVSAALAGVIPSLALAFTPKPFSPLVEAKNFSKAEERQAIQGGDDDPAHDPLPR